MGEIPGGYSGVPQAEVPPEALLSEELLRQCSQGGDEGMRQMREVLHQFGTSGTERQRQSIERKRVTRRFSSGFAAVQSEFR